MSEEFSGDERPYDLPYADIDYPVGNAPAYLEYTCHQTYALAITSGDASSSSIAPFPEDLRICTGSYNDHGRNQIQVLGIQSELIADPKLYAQQHYIDENEGHGQDDLDQPPRPSPQNDLECLANHGVLYPPTKVAFGPPGTDLRGTFEVDPDVVKHFIATSSNALRIYAYNDKIVLQDSQYVGRSKTKHKGSFTRLCKYPKTSVWDEELVPVTSFDWCTAEDSHIVTSNNSGQCSVWDLKGHSQIAMTIFQLEAAVFDVTWEPGCRHTFVAATKNEAIHYVDTRAVGRTQTLYKSPMGSCSATSYRDSDAASHAMARVAFDPRNPYLLATLQLNDNVVRVLDTRNPGFFVAELIAHDDDVNGIAWRGWDNSGQTLSLRGPSLATVSDDCRVLLWDTEELTTPAGAEGTGKGKGRVWRGTPTHESILPEAAENVAWGVDNDYLAVTMGSRIRCMRI